MPLPASCRWRRRRRRHVGGVARRAAVPNSANWEHRHGVDEVGESRGSAGGEVKESLRSLGTFFTFDAVQLDEGRCEITQQERGMVWWRGREGRARLPAS